MTSEKNPDPPIASEFEASRPHLQAVAYRMLSSRSEAEDAVQEAWLKVSRADSGAVGNLRGWLTAVVARVCLDMLRSRKSRREQPGELLEELHGPESAEPAHRAALADSVGAALSLVLETLSPNERLALKRWRVRSLGEPAPLAPRSSTGATGRFGRPTTSPARPSS